MESKGRLISAERDFRTHKVKLAFEVDTANDESINELVDADLTIKAVKYRKSRSLNSNAYFWKLVNLIAEKQPGTSDRYIHDKFLSENRAYMYDDQGVFIWKVSTEEPNEFGLLKEGSTYWIDSDRVVRFTDDDGEPLINRKTGEPQVAHVFWRIKGTHEMDSKEMSRIIDDVVQEAKGLGIETLPPAEIERMLEAWKPTT